MKKWWQGLALDLRSLALLRIMMGLLLLLDLGIRATDLQAHYTDAGCQPAYRVLQWSWNPAFWSVHLAQGHWLGQALLFLVTAVAYVCLTVGYRTRLFGWLSWFLLISMQNRNPVILDGGDLYFRCLMFWLLFCPWAACWSVDASRAGVTPPARVWNLACAAYCWQITLIYAFAYLLKVGNEWKVDGTAVQLALLLDQITSPPAQLLVGHPDLLRFLNFAVLYFEGAAALLIWIPQTRLLAVVGLTGLHLGLGSFMHLGVFSLIASVSSWALLPGWLWDRWPSWRWTLPDWPWRGFEDPSPRPSRLIVNILLLFLLMRVTACNIYWGRHWTVMPNCPDLRLLRLDQQWNMFAPRPLADDGYFVIVGETQDGDWVNIGLTGPPEVRWDKPARVASCYPNARWRKLMMNTFLPENQVWRAPLLDYLGSRWQGRHPQRPLRSLHLFFVLEKSLPDGQEGPLQVSQLCYQPKRVVSDRDAASTYATLGTGLEVLRALGRAPESVRK